MTSAETNPILKLIELIESYLHDGTYAEFIEIKRADFKSASDSLEAKLLEDDLVAVLSLPEKEIEKLILVNTMGISAFPSEEFKKHQSPYTALLNKVYFDLYSETPDFKQSLLKYVDGEGKLLTQ